MKIYDKRPSEGHRNIVGYLCDYCEEFHRGEDLDSSWLQEQVELSTAHHYCPDCTTFCILCHQAFSKKYEEDWFKKGLCERCQ